MDGWEIEASLGESRGLGNELPKEERERMRTTVTTRGGIIKNVPESFQSPIMAIAQQALMSPSALFWASWQLIQDDAPVCGSYRRARPNAYTICEARMPRGRAAGAFWHGWCPARARATRGSRMMRSGTTPSPAPTAAAATTLCLDPEYRGVCRTVLTCACAHGGGDLLPTSDVHATRRLSVVCALLPGRARVYAPVLPCGQSYMWWV
ncbi:hypothetical protein B0H11DRAFT_2189699 [Mycena galericulata]|nr:hypothetical protein B0H11DRAFT_2189699 [Mycena galericulata]